MLVEQSVDANIRLYMAVFYEKRRFVMASKGKGKKRAVIVVSVIVVILLAVLIAVFAFVKGKLNLIQYDDGTNSYDATIAAGEEDDIDLDLSGLEDVGPQGLPGGEIYTDESVLNVLLLGTDEQRVQFSDNARSDTMILLSVDLDAKTAKLVSLERGMGVPILEGPYKGQYDWLTHCFRYGGADLVMKEIRECFKVDVEHYIRVNFHAVIEIVDLLGGIDINLTQAEADYINSGSNGYVLGRDKELQKVTAGANRLNGVTALAYARCRKIDSDWQRVKRQQTVIQACVDRLKNADVATLNSMLNQVLPMVKTNFTQWEIAKLMMVIPDFLGVQFERMTLPASGTYGSMTGMGGRKMYAPDFNENAKILREFLYG